MTSSTTIALYLAHDAAGFAATFAGLLATSPTPITVQIAVGAAGIAAIEQSAPQLMIGWTFLRDPGLRRLNRLALDRAVPLLFCSSRAGGGQIGPAIVPGETGCSDCFEHYHSIFPRALPYCALDSAAELDAPLGEFPAPLIERLAAATQRADLRLPGEILEWSPAGERCLRVPRNPLCATCSPLANHPIEMFITPLRQRG